MGQLGDCQRLESRPQFQPKSAARLKCTQPAISAGAGRGEALTGVDKSPQGRAGTATGIIQPRTIETDPALFEDRHQRPGCDVVLAPVSERADNAQPGPGIAEAAVDGIDADDEGGPRLDGDAIAALLQLPGQ